MDVTDVACNVRVSEDRLIVALVDLKMELQELHDPICVLQTDFDQVGTSGKASEENVAPRDTAELLRDAVASAGEGTDFDRGVWGQLEELVCRGLRRVLWLGLRDCLGRRQCVRCVYKRDVRIVSQEERGTSGTRGRA